MLELKATNTITGEIFTVEVNPKDPDNLGLALLDIQALKKNLEKLEAAVKDLAMEYLESNSLRTVALQNGYDWKIISGNRKSYNPAVVLSEIDQDMLISKGAVAVVNGKLESLMAELVAENSLPAEASAAILESVEIKPMASYVKLEKVVAK